MADKEEEPEGKIVTPLPPHLVHSTPGIVTPKAPLQFAKEQKLRLQDVPDEVKEDGNEL